MGKKFKNAISNSSKDIGSIGAKDQVRGGMDTGENIEHYEGLFELDDKEYKDSNDEMLWKR